jgi:hypothetical protein
MRGEGGGRPPKILTEKDLRQIELLSGLGLTLPKICACIGISPSELSERAKTEEEVSGVLLRGRAKAEAAVSKSLFERATEGDVAAIRFWLASRAGWTIENREKNAPAAAAQIVIYLPENGRDGPAAG